MSHRKFEEYLVDFVTGDLGQDLEAEVHTHLDACQLCREWLETYLALETVAGNSRAHEVDHPTSETLARFTIDPRFLDQEAGELVKAHLEECPTCADESALCRQSVTATPVTQPRSGGPEQESPAFSAAAKSQSTPWLSPVFARSSLRTALAASVLLAVVGGGAYLTLSNSAPERYILAERTLSDVATFEALETIEATNSGIGTGANVTLRAKSVALGDGFSVANGASFTIENFAK